MNPTNVMNREFVEKRHRVKEQKYAIKMQKNQLYTFKNSCFRIGLDNNDTIFVTENVTAIMIEKIYRRVRYRYYC